MWKKKYWEYNIAFWVFVFLITIGFFTFFSVSLAYLKNPEIFYRIVLIQFISIFLGFSILWLILKKRVLNFVTIRKYSLYIFVFAFFFQLAILIPGVGENINGATRWISIFGFSFQPSELFRFGLVLLLANIFLAFPEIIKNFKKFLIFFSPLVLVVFIIFTLIKDSGTLFTIFLIILGMVIFTPVNKKHLFSTIVASASVIVLLIYLFLPHAVKRVTDFQNHKNDISGSYYQYHNMLVAIGSGGLDGVGYMHSVQKFNHSVPEMLSDSIFSIYAEEWGFIGSVLLVFLYWFLFIFIILNLRKIKDDYTKYVVIGLSFNLFIPVFYNILANLSVVPMSGFPLTFVSKGGSNILISIISMGLILLAFLEIKDKKIN